MKSMNKVDCLKNILKNGGLFSVLIVITFYLIFRKENIGGIISTVTEVNPIYILIAVGCMCAFVCCEAVNIGRTLNIYNYDTNFAKCIKYALAGFFFSSVTPMATGGQPMQIYYMYKDDIEVSHSALALMMELASYQFVTVTMAVMAFIIKFHFFDSIGYHVKYVLMLGVMLNTCILAVIIMAFFSKRSLEKVIEWGIGILSKLHSIGVLNKLNARRIGGIREKAMNQLEMYQKGAAAFKENKLVIIKILLTTILQILAFHSIPFWIYRAFGYYEYSFATVIAIQAVLYITVSAIPLPGSVGASESGFVLIFRTLFPAQVINSAMLLSRGISFYLFLCISGICIAIVQMMKSKSKNVQMMNSNSKNVQMMDSNYKNVKNECLYRTEQ